MPRIVQYSPYGLRPNPDEDPDAFSDRVCAAYTRDHGVPQSAAFNPVPAAPANQEQHGHS